MQFKHPEFLYFLFLLVVPILVHLFQLRRFKKTYFTNVHFLKELSTQTRKSSKIKKWLLLFTRLFLLAFLIIAFAQPFFTATESSKATNEMYIVLDNSYSMQAKGKKGELLKRAVQELLEHTPENQNFSLLTNTENYWSTDINSIRKELQNLKYSPSPFRLEHLITKVNSHKSPLNKDIIVVTDAVGLEPKQTKGFHKEDNVYFVIPEIEQKNNLSIDSVFIHQTLNNFYELGVTISTSTSESKNISVALYNHEQLTAKTLVNIENKSKTIKFTIPKEEFNGYVSIIDKGLEYDNNYYFSISKISKTRLISIGKKENSQFLAKIFTKDEFDYTNYEIGNLDYNLLEKQDAILLNELKDIPQSLQTTLKSFYNKGGNLVIIPNAETNVSDFNKFIQNFGAIQFNSLNRQGKKITKINFAHPLFTGVFEKKIENFQYPSVQISFMAKSASPSILTFEDQSPFLSSVSNGLASLYVLTAPINIKNSNFQNSPLIVPTFYKMVQSNQRSGINSITIDRNTPYIVETELTKDEIVNVKSKTENFIPLQQLINNKVKLTFDNHPTNAGNYEIYNGDKFIQNISFNFDRTESNLSLANTEVATNFIQLENIETIFDTLHSNRTDTQIWKWFVMLALLFLVVELLIQKFVK